MKNKIILCFLIIGVIFISGCSKTVSEITENDDFIDEKVSVKGIVKAPVKFGSLSGYTLIDKNEDKIIVATDELPKENEKVTAKGILKKGILGVGYYIDSN